MQYPIYKDKGIEKHRIASYQMDLKGQATLPVLCNLFQEIAGNHAAANRFGFFDMIKLNRMWVLTRLRVEIDKYPQWNDEIFIETWVKFRKSLFTEREFLLTNKKGKKLAGARSGWMLLDLNTKRPVSVEDFPVSIEMFPDDSAVKHPLKKLDTVKKSDMHYNREVRFQDIDVNMHVNNVKYLEWFLSAFPYEFRKTHNVKNFEINYKAEMKFGDSGDIKTEQVTDQIYRSEIFNKETGKEICKAEFDWHKI